MNSGAGKMTGAKDLTIDDLKKIPPIPLPPRNDREYRKMHE